METKTREGSGHWHKVRALIKFRSLWFQIEHNKNACCLRKQTDDSCKISEERAWPVPMSLHSCFLVLTAAVGNDWILTWASAVAISPTQHSELSQILLSVSFPGKSVTSQFLSPHQHTLYCSCCDTYYITLWLLVHLPLSPFRFFPPYFLAAHGMEILVAWPGIMPPAVEAQSLNHWTTWEVPQVYLFIEETLWSAQLCPALKPKLLEK